MLKVFHFPLCPFSRFVRILLHELGQKHSLQYEQFWLRQESFVSISPAASVPALVEKEQNIIIHGIHAIFEYFVELEGNNSMIIWGRSLSTADLQHRAKTRSLLDWFFYKFYSEVTYHLLSENIIKSIAYQGSPNSVAIRIAQINMLNNLKYIDS